MWILFAFLSAFFHGVPARRVLSARVGRMPERACGRRRGGLAALDGPGGLFEPGPGGHDQLPGLPGTGGFEQDEIIVGHDDGEEPLIGQALLPAQVPESGLGVAGFAAAGHDKVGRPAAGEGAPAQQRGEEYSKADVAYAFQRSAIDPLVEKTVEYALSLGVGCVTAGGGVIANGYLREKLSAACKKAGLKLVLPEKKYCTDNAAMIASEGLNQYLAGNFAPMDINACAAIPLKT